MLPPTHETLLLLFWFSLTVLAYTFAGYGLLLFGLAKAFRSPLHKSIPTQWPSVSVVLVAHNEEQRITARVQNLLESDYPADKLDVLVVSDGSTDQTFARARDLDHPQVRLIDRLERKGKAPCLNAGVAAAMGEIIVFCDARQRFTPQTISQLVKNFSDPTLGAVSGNNNIDPSISNIGGGVDIYWRLEKFIRYAESWLDSSIGCTGAIYAIRKALYRPIPEDTILDDVVIPMQIALEGYRIGFDPEACSFDPQQNEPDREHIRKRRTLAGNFQMLFRYPHWLLPWRNRLWWQLISHKYLRLAAPLCMVIVFALNAMLLGEPFYFAAFVAQCAFYSLAAIGLLFSSLKVSLFSIPAGFVFLNVMTIRGLIYYLRSPSRRGWELVRS